MAATLQVQVGDLFVVHKDRFCRVMVEALRVQYSLSEATMPTLTGSACGAVHPAPLAANREVLTVRLAKRAAGSKFCCRNKGGRRSHRGDTAGAA